MFRMIRRAPWIALGAAGAYYLDGSSGEALRDAAAAWTRNQLERGRDRWRATLISSSAEDGGTIVVPDAMAQTILEDSEERVTDRVGTSGERRRSEDTVEPLAI